MKKLFPLVLLVSALFSLNFNALAGNDDDELSAKIVGTWTTDPADLATISGTSTYKADGTGTKVMEQKGQLPGAAVRVTTKWSIKNGILTVRNIKSSNPKMLPEGVEVKERIIFIGDKRFVYEPYDTVAGKFTGKQKLRFRKD
jgi:hypothetical protein